MWQAFTLIRLWQNPHVFFYFVFPNNDIFSFAIGFIGQNKNWTPKHACCSASGWGVVGVYEKWLLRWGWVGRSSDTTKSKRLSWMFWTDIRRDPTVTSSFLVERRSLSQLRIHILCLASWNDHQEHNQELSCFCNNVHSSNVCSKEAPCIIHRHVIFSLFWQLFISVSALMGRKKRSADAIWQLSTPGTSGLRDTGEDPWLWTERPRHENYELSRSTDPLYPILLKS